MEDLKDAIVNLNLDLIPEDWVAEIWSNNFSEESSLPVELTNEICLDDLNEKILEAIVATKNCIKEGRQSVPGDNFNWQVLIDGDVPKKSLICFLSTFIKHDITEVNNGQIIIPALFAARLYVLLLCIPGAAVFNFFHPMLFDQCLGLLHIGNKLVTSISKPAKKSKSKKRQSNDDEDDANSEENTLTSAEKEEILQILCLYLTEMSECFEIVKLKGEVLSIDIIVKALIDVASLELKSNIFKNSPRLNTIGYAAWKAYSVLDKLCSEDHGSVREIIRIVFKAFTKFLYLKEENIRLSLKDDDTIRRINILSFILKLVEKHEEAAADNIIALLQQLLVRIPDKADIRGKATTEIVNFVESLSPKLIEDYSLWVVSLSFGDMVKHKVAAVELISKILTSKDNTENKRLHEILLTALLSNTLDKSSLVRYKCLNIFASNIFSTQPEIKDIITKLFVNAEDINNNDEVKHTDFFDFNSYFKECIKSKNFSLPPDNILPTGSRIIKLLEHFCFDDKVYVRKSALLALSNICILNKRWVNQLRLQILDIACKDLSVMIRKQMAKCVTDLLLTYPLHKGILETWVNGVVTLVTDNDVKSQEKVFEYIFEVIIGNITHASKEKSPINSLPWRILDTIAHKEKRKFLRLACRTWAIQKTIKEPVFNNIVSHIDTHNSYTAWFLIGCLSEFLDYPNPNFIYKYFSENVNLKNSGNDTLDLLVIEALFLNWRGTKLEIQEKLFDDLKLSLEEFRTPHHLIARSLDILFQMKRTETIEWCAQLTNFSGKYISSVMIPENTNAINSTILSRYVFTLGEAALFHPGVDENVINSVADIIESAGLSKRLRKSRVDLKAVGVVTLAKLCLQDHFLAKQYVPKLANLLNDASTSVIVKVNTLAGLADLCVRFTSVVEDYLGNFCLALKDSSEEVRKSALEHIMQLIMEDYLKLKSPLFYYLSTMLLDPSTEIKEMYESFIMNCVLKKQPSIMTHFFIQAIFFFNDFEGKKGFYNDEMSENEQILFGLAGVNNFENREKIYKFMLKAMQDDHRFKIQNRICIDILDSVCEDKIVLNIVGNAVLKDALNVMACQEMRLEHLRKDDEEQPAEDNAEDNFVMGMARKIILSQILKKNYVESLVPVVARLRKKLMALKSPLTKDLMICLTEIMKDFKQEINEIFAADPQLAAEVEFDLRNSADSSIIEQLGDAEPEIQEKISCISQLAIGSENIGGFMNTTIQQLMGSDDDGPLSPPSVPLSHSQDSSKLSEPSTSSELITSASLSLTTSKIDSVRKSLPVLKPSVELSSASSDPSTSNTDVSTEYSYNIPVSSIPPATKINFTSSSNDSSTLSSSSSNKKSTRRKRKK